jgi:hypothetical protein
MLEDPAGQRSHETPKTIQVTHSPGMLGGAEANPRLTTATAAIMIIRIDSLLYVRIMPIYGTAH